MLRLKRWLETCADRSVLLWLIQVLRCKHVWETWERGRILYSRECRRCGWRQTLIDPERFRKY